jgi:hypothetical protein
MPQLLRLTNGRLVITHERIVSATVWLAREDHLDDGRTVSGETSIHVDCQEGLDPVAAHRLAAELVAAAELGTLRQIDSNQPRR